MARVLVVEDDHSIAYAVQLSLEAEGFEVEVRNCLRTALNASEQSTFDVAILDVRMERVDDGLTIARRLRSDRAATSILFLTAADHIEARLEGFAAGADDYLTKPFAMAELLARVRALLRRSGKSTGGSWQIADLEIDECAGRVRRAGSDLGLTPTEFALLVSLARRPGRVVGKEELLRELWALTAFDANLVEVHVSALRRKLETHGERVVHTARTGGYVFRVESSLENIAPNELFS